MRFSACLPGFVFFRIACADDCVPDSPQLLQRQLQLSPRLEAEKAELSPEQVAAKEQLSEFHFFVKFHKVGGSTVRSILDQLTGAHELCSSICGDAAWTCRQSGLDAARCVEQHPYVLLPCPQGNVPKSCSDHGSLDVLREAYSGKSISAANSSDLTSLMNLWPDKTRYTLLYSSEMAKYFLPSVWPAYKRLVVTTLLRDPLEKLRSYYYFSDRQASRKRFEDFLGFQRDFVAGNWTPESFERQRRLGNEGAGAATLDMAARSCCEFREFLGQGDVEKAKQVLVTQFDLVGIAERMSETLVCLGRLYGKTPSEMGAVAKLLGDANVNGDSKLDWLPREKEVATYVTAGDREVYDFAAQLFDRQSVSLWNNPQTLDASTRAFDAVRYS